MEFEDEWYSKKTKQEIINAVLFLVALIFIVASVVILVIYKEAYKSKFVVTIYNTTDGFSIEKSDLYVEQYYLVKGGEEVQVKITPETGKYISGLIVDGTVLDASKYNDGQDAVLKFEVNENTDIKVQYAALTYEIAVSNMGIGGKITNEAVVLGGNDLKLSETPLITNCKKAQYGEMVCVCLRPDSGYVPKELFYYDFETYEKISLLDKFTWGPGPNKNNTYIDGYYHYEFMMPAKDITIYATFE